MGCLIGHITHYPESRFSADRLHLYLQLYTLLLLTPQSYILQLFTNSPLSSTVNSVVTRGGGIPLVAVEYIVEPRDSLSPSITSTCSYNRTYFCVYVCVCVCTQM